MIPLRQTLQAQIDVQDVVDDLTEASPAAAERFVAGVEASLDFLRRFPRAGGRLATRYRKLKSYRVWKVQGFRSYLIFYRIRRDGIEVVRVLHGARNWEQLIE